MTPDPIERPIHNMAMALYEIETVAILMCSIASLSPLGYAATQLANARARQELRAMDCE